TSTPDVAKQQAAQVGDTAAQAGSQVVDVAKEQAANVASETQAQAKNLLGQTRSELQSQAGQQQQRAASGLRSLGSELQKMANNSDHEDGPASQVARQVADRIDTAASWLQDRDPGQVMTEVQRFARQRPGAFLAIAATAGLLAGRLTRGLTADSQSDGAQSGGTYAGTYPDTATSGYAGTYPTDAGFSSGAGLSGGAAMGSQPDSGWPATGAAPDPGGYAAGFGSDQSFDTTTPPPAVWGQDPVVPEGEGTYYDPGTGTESGTGTYPAADPGYGTGTGSGRVGQ
ncbi:MAG: hypothetical protein M3381_01200, partial [Actinomycetota bacterium]|nr:hypothetical protein [Actinomycetota bacterium]